MNSEINKAAEALRSAKRVFVLTGAGVSAESGVPTFRGGGGTSVWRGMPFEQLSSAKMVEKNLPLVWEWFDYRRGVVSECRPNAAHKALAACEWGGRFSDFKLVTQNVDGLHDAAGSTDVIELHGNIWRARCLTCEARREMREVPIDERPPLCIVCGDVMRPDVVLFGETLPEGAFDSAQWYAKNCDVCLVVGTSALVYPAAALPEVAHVTGVFVIEINPEETAFRHRCDISLRGLAGEVLPQLLPYEDRELTLSIGCEGGGQDIYRKKTESGGWKYSVEGSSMGLNEDDEEETHSWAHDAGDTFDEAIESLGLGESLVMFSPVKIHPECREAMWAIVSRIAENLSDDFRERVSPGGSGHHLELWRRMTVGSGSRSGGR